MTRQYQGGPSLEIFSAAGSKPLDDLKISVPKAVHRRYDKTLKAACVTLDGDVAPSCRISLASTPLGIRHPIIGMQVYVGSVNSLFFEFLCSDSGGSRRRIVLSTASKTIHTDPLHAKLPLIGVKRNIWLNLCLDLRSIYSKAFSFTSKELSSIEQVTIGPTCRVRRIVSLRDQLPEYVNDCSELPSALDFPPGVRFETQVLFMSEKSKSIELLSRCVLTDQTVIVDQLTALQYPNSSVDTSVQSLGISSVTCDSTLVAIKERVPLSEASPLHVNNVSRQKCNKMKRTYNPSDYSPNRQESAVQSSPASVKSDKLNNSNRYKKQNTVIEQLNRSPITRKGQIEQSKLERQQVSRYSPGSRSSPPPSRSHRDQSAPISDRRESTNHLISSSSSKLDHDVRFNRIPAYHSPGKSDRSSRSPSSRPHRPASRSPPVSNSVKMEGDCYQDPSNPLEPEESISVSHHLSNNESPLDQHDKQSKLRGQELREANYAGGIPLHTSRQRHSSPPHPPSEMSVSELRESDYTQQPGKHPLRRSNGGKGSKNPTTYSVSEMSVSELRESDYASQRAALRTRASITTSASTELSVSELRESDINIAGMLLNSTSFCGKKKTAVNKHTDPLRFIASELETDSGAIHHKLLQLYSKKRSLVNSGTSDVSMQSTGIADLIKVMASELSIDEIDVIQRTLSLQGKQRSSAGEKSDLEQQVGSQPATDNGSSECGNSGETFIQNIYCSLPDEHSLQTSSLCVSDLRSKHSHNTKTPLLEEVLHSNNNTNTNRSDPIYQHDDNMKTSSKSLPDEHSNDTIPIIPREDSIIETIHTDGSGSQPVTNKVINNDDVNRILQEHGTPSETETKPTKELQRILKQYRTVPEGSAKSSEDEKEEILYGASPPDSCSPSGTESSQIINQNTVVSHPDKQQVQSDVEEEHLSLDGILADRPQQKEGIPGVEHGTQTTDSFVQLSPAKQNLNSKSTKSAATSPLGSLKEVFSSPNDNSNSTRSVTPSPAESSNSAPTVVPRGRHSLDPTDVRTSTEGSAIHSTEPSVCRSGRRISEPPDFGVNRIATKRAGYKIPTSSDNTTYGVAASSGRRISEPPDFGVKRTESSDSPKSSSARDSPNHRTVSHPFGNRTISTSSTTDVHQQTGKLSRDVSFPGLSPIIRVIDNKSKIVPLDWQEGKSPLLETTTDSLLRVKDNLGSPDAAAQPTRVLLTAEALKKMHEDDIADEIADEIAGEQPLKSTEVEEQQKPIPSTTILNNRYQQLLSEYEMDKSVQLHKTNERGSNDHKHSPEEVPTLAATRALNYDESIVDKPSLYDFSKGNLYEESFDNRPNPQKALLFEDSLEGTGRGNLLQEDNRNNNQKLSQMEDSLDNASKAVVGKALQFEDSLNPLQEDNRNNVQKCFQVEDSLETASKAVLGKALQFEDSLVHTQRCFQTEDSLEVASKAVVGKTLQFEDTLENVTKGTTKNCNRTEDSLETASRAVVGKALQFEDSLEGATRAVLGNTIQTQIGEGKSRYSNIKEEDCIESTNGLQHEMDIIPPTSNRHTNFNYEMQLDDINSGTLQLPFGIKPNSKPRYEDIDDKLQRKQSLQTDDSSSTNSKGTERALLYEDGINYCGKRSHPQTADRNTNSNPHEERSAVPAHNNDSLVNCTNTKRALQYEESLEYKNTNSAEARRKRIIAKRRACHPPISNESPKQSTTIMKKPDPVLSSVEKHLMHVNFEAQMMSPSEREDVRRSLLNGREIGNVDSAVAEKQHVQEKQQTEEKERSILPKGLTYSTSTFESVGMDAKVAGNGFRPSIELVQGTPKTKSKLFPDNDKSRLTAPASVGNNLTTATPVRGFLFNNSTMNEFTADIPTPIIGEKSSAFNDDCCRYSGVNNLLGSLNFSPAGPPRPISRNRSERSEANTQSRLPPPLHRLTDVDDDCVVIESQKCSKSDDQLSNWSLDDQPEQSEKRTLIYDPSLQMYFDPDTNEFFADS